ncbi:glycosyltransferase family 2 protein [Agromyces sp. NPDC057865]|uniref:glycosyltransferase family 2 protein n=1 Tax=Agromyces sp. NPDC057865 TaxID=3346267 RepID=UPI00367114BD
MTAGPSVDVVVATHRLLPFLAVALESVRDQTWLDRRIIVVDDGCADPEAVERVAGPEAIVLHRRNGGQAAARNSGIDAGDGELVAFLDDDDVWPPGRLEQLVGVLAARPDALAAFGDGRYVDADGRPFGSWATADASREDFLSGATPIPRITTMVVRRDALARTGPFDTTFRLAEDDEFILRMLRLGPMASSGTVVVDYRRHDDNITRADWRTRYAASVRAIRVNIDAATTAGDERSVELLRRNLRRYRSMMAAGAPARIGEQVRGRDVGGAVAEVRDALRISPSGFARGAFETVASRLRLTSPGT